jgi:MFS family permease
LEDTADPRKQRSSFGPSAVLTQPPFLLFSASRLCSGIAQTMHQATLAWQVYELTGSPLSLASLGGVRFVAQVVGSLIGGAVADTADRGKTVVVAQFVPVVATSLLIWLTASRQVNLPVILAIVLCLGLANAFENPARQALLPQLVRREHFQTAVATSSTFQQLSFALGPMIAGIAISSVGVNGAYAITVGLIMTSAALIAIARPMYPMVVRAGGLSVGMVKEGFQYVWSKQPVIGAMALDTIAVMFAGAQALLPIYAQDILAVGPEGYGMLNSSQGIGAFVMSLALLFLPQIQRCGRALVLTLAMFGVFTLVFALSRNFVLSLAAYALTGAFDQIGVVMRQTIIQMGTPDALRGRVSAVNQVFIGAANQLGALHVSTVAQFSNATFALVYGSVGCLAGITLLAYRLPALWRHDIRRDAGERAREAAAADALTA